MDYKEMYEKAIKRAKAMIPIAANQEEIYNSVITIFPELKGSTESEDERIRKELIEQVVYIVPNDDEVDSEGNVLPIYQKRIDKYLAWLEKQGNLTIRFFTDEFEWALGRIIAFWNQNHKDGKYDENELMSYIKVRETELVKLFTDNVCKVSLSDCTEEYRKAYYDGYNKCNRDWLKIKDISVDEYNKNAEILLGGQGEQKPCMIQWKAVDKEIYVKEPALAQRKDKSEPNHGYVICYDHTLTPDVYERFIMISDIYNQSHWKPSDEQMDALNDVISSRDIKYDVLSELWKDLKKLRKEKL